MLCSADAVTVIGFMGSTTPCVRGRAGYSEKVGATQMLSSDQIVLSDSMHAVEFGSIVGHTQHLA
jgi:hypothetical protein